MALRRRNAESEAAGGTGGTENQLERLTRLVALLVVKDEPQRDKIRILHAAGFSNAEVGELLGLTANAVKLVLLRIRSKK